MRWSGRGRRVGHFKPQQQTIVLNLAPYSRNVKRPEQGPLSIAERSDSHWRVRCQPPQMSGRMPWYSTWQSAKADTQCMQPAIEHRIGGEQWWPRPRNNRMRGFVAMHGISQPASAQPSLPTSIHEQKPTPTLHTQLHTLSPSKQHQILAKYERV